jgi:hypothetical protein
MGIRETADAPLMELLIAGILDRELLLVLTIWSMCWTPLR